MSVKKTSKEAKMKRIMAGAALALTMSAFADATNGPAGSASSFATTPVAVDARVQVQCARAVAAFESRFMTWAYSGTIPFTSFPCPFAVIFR